MTVNEILLEAFQKVQDEHGIAIKFVNFDLINVSTHINEMYAVGNIEINAVAISNQEHKK